MFEKSFTKNMVELIRRTSCILPSDIIDLIKKKRKQENPVSRGDIALDLILQNIYLAKMNCLPVCQDTGHLTFYLQLPTDVDPSQFKVAIEKAVQEATEKGCLRQNSVDSLTGKNSGNNLGSGTPTFHFDFHDEDHIEIRLIQKGGGCENMSAQYSLPHTFQGKSYGRNLEGAYACILDAVNNAQGKGCSPGFLGVCIGGDRAEGYNWAKHQFLRHLNDTNPIPELDKLENRILEAANQLGIGPLGFGGKFTLGSCKIGTRNRIPASYFVTIAYSCWAFRRRGFILDRDGNVIQWLYQKPETFDPVSEQYPDFSEFSKDAVHLATPVDETRIRSLHIGDVVLISGTLFTGRDAVHQYLFEGGELDLIKGGLFYHCGPIIQKRGDTYIALGAGPTTSIREEPYESEIIERFQLKAIIGKGGMGEGTLLACKKYGCVYLHAIGGAAQIYASCIKKVVSVHLEQFGSPEAVWELEVENFPAVVTMDAHGNSLHKDQKIDSDKVLDSLLSS